MNLRKFRREELSINLTPLIDVVFLLLIFFMVTTTFREESEIEIDLPQATDEPVEVSKDVVEIMIDNKGQYYVNEKPLVNAQLNTLKQALRQVVTEGQTPPVIISADAQSPHQSVVTAMDAARQLGLVRLSIATRQGND